MEKTYPLAESKIDFSIPAIYSVISHLSLWLGSKLALNDQEIFSKHH